MFEFLNELPDDELLTGVYFALKRLEHPARFADALAAAIPGVSAGDRQVASRIIDEINAVEGTSWKPGDSDVVGKYALELCEIEMARGRNRPGFDPERGLRNLARMHELVANGKTGR